MKRVLVTGASGFIGKNLVSTLERMEDIEIMEFDLENSEEELKLFCEKADFIFHLAGVNRPQNQSEFKSGNRDFTELLVETIKQGKRKVPVLLTSSIQAFGDSAYGTSKKAAEEIIYQYGQEAEVTVYIYRLPNVFGKWCRPNYNSVVATWCHHIAHGLPIEIHNPDAKVSLVYIDDVVKDFICALEGVKLQDSDHFCHIDKIFCITLKELSEILYEFQESRQTLCVPNLDGQLERFLYATYLSYLPKEQFSYPLQMKYDNRGWLSEFIKSRQFGQVFISRTKPGITRGNHWHHTKVEKFLVLSGNALVRFRHIHEGDVIEYTVSGDKLEVLDIPSGFTHSITNVGDTDMITLFWADEIFDSQNPDTYYLEV